MACRAKMAACRPSNISPQDRSVSNRQRSDTGAGLIDGPPEKTSHSSHPNQGSCVEREKRSLDLADVPPEIEWFANITNPQTRRAHQCERNAVMHNPVKGVKRPKANNNEDLTLALVTSKAACS